MSKIYLKKEHLEVSDLDLQEIARQVKEGNRGGIIDSEDEGGYRIVWDLKIDKFES